TFVVSTRADSSAGGNSFTPSVIRIPGEKMDPVDRFAAIRESMGGRRGEVTGGADLMGAISGLANLLPTSVVTGIARSPAGRIGMSDTPRVSRTLAIFDLDHGILKESPASMLGPQYATAERISRFAGPLLGPTLFRVLTPNGGTSEDVRDAGRTAAATIELAPH